MRHATWNAILALLGTEDDVERVSMHHACDWVEAPGTADDSFTDSGATALARGENAKLPTCPHCAVLVDQALAIRAAHLQAIAEAA